MPRGGGTRNSFSPETPVWTAEGQVPIGELAVGDAVLGYHEATGNTDTYTVTAVWAHEDPVVVALTIDAEVITTTREHPFYVLLREWVPAEKLRVGDSIRRADGSYGVVAAVDQAAHPQVMYNLSVATAHTFFVGDVGWLVHNARPERFIRYVSKEEAELSVAACGLLPRPGHERQPKWVARDDAPYLGPDLGKRRRTHRLEFNTQSGTEQWLKDWADEQDHLNLRKDDSVEPGCYAVPADMIEEFNKRIIGTITSTKI